jgi:hypothetical protein
VYPISGLGAEGGGQNFIILQNISLPYPTMGSGESPTGFADSREMKPDPTNAAAKKKQKCKFNETKEKRKCPFHPLAGRRSR